MIDKSIKSSLESMMFIWGEPLDSKIVAEVLGISKKEVYSAFQSLKNEYEEKKGGLRIIEVNKTFQFVTAPENYEYLQRLCTPKKEKKLSSSSMEVLAIIAYKQPITKGEIDSVRGVKCDRVIENLMKKELIEEKGRAISIGRPILYGTTDVFLKHFGLKDIKNLPNIENIENTFDDTEESNENSDQIKLNI